MRKILKIIWIIFSSILIFILSSWIITTTIHHIVSDIKVENFKKNGVLQEELSSSTVKFYKIASNETPGYVKNGNLIMPGSEKCDVIVSRKSIIPIPFVRDLVTFFAGGHAALITGDYRDYNIYSTEDTIIEATGLNESLNLSELNDRTYWSYEELYNEVIVLRANNISEKQKDDVISKALSMLDDPYNYSFTFDTTNKSYCSDLISKSFENAGINFNKNGYWTTIHDLIVSNDCHIAYYHYYENGIKYIYYLG